MAIDYYKDHKFKDQNIKPLLDLLIKVFAVYILMNDKDNLFESGFFGKGSLKLINDSFAKLLTTIRPHMIPLAETFTLFGE